MATDYQNQLFSEVPNSHGGRQEGACAQGGLIVPGSSSPSPPSSTLQLISIFLVDTLLASLLSSVLPAVTLRRQCKHAQINLSLNLYFSVVKIVEKNPWFL